MTTISKKTQKIVIVSHALVVPENQTRWRRLANDKSLEIHLLVPKYWESSWFFTKKIYRTEKISDDNFHIHPISTTSIMNWSKYLYKSFDANFKKIKPDLIYVIQDESSLIHHQIYLYKKIFAPKAKIIFFSMNARGIPYQLTKNPIKKSIKKYMWNKVISNTDAAIVHYPGCLKSLQQGGYKKPIFLQTQIGVDEHLFVPNKEIRKEYRKKISFTDKFVIGYAGRITSDKGVDDLLYVFIELIKKYKNIALLLIGNGDLVKIIESDLESYNIKNRVHITGFVNQDEVPKYMNAIDLFVLCSKTTNHWIDTFPLVTVQAQSIKIPVVASNSGSIPWQLEDTAKIFNERDRADLYCKIESFINNYQDRKHYAEKGQRRCHENFSQSSMNINFKKIINQVINEKFIYHEENEKFKSWKPYNK